MSTQYNMNAVECTSEAYIPFITQCHRNTFTKKELVTVPKAKVCITLREVCTHHGYWLMMYDP